MTALPSRSRVRNSARVAKSRRTPRNASIATIVDDLIACGRNQKRVKYKLIQGCLMDELRDRGHEDPDAIRRGFLAGAFFDEVFASIIVEDLGRPDITMSLVREALNSEKPSLRIDGAKLAMWSHSFLPDQRQQFVAMLADRWRVENVVEVRNEIARAMPGRFDAPVFRSPMEPGGDVITSGPWCRQRGRGKRRARR